jgi:hypothetical protein
MLVFNEQQSTIVTAVKTTNVIHKALEMFMLNFCYVSAACRFYVLICYTKKLCGCQPFWWLYYVLMAVLRADGCITC